MRRAAGGKPVGDTERAGGQTHAWPKAHLLSPWRRSGGDERHRRASGNTFVAHVKRLSPLRVVLAVIVVSAAFLISPSPSLAAPPPPDPAQVREDVFPCGQGCNLQDYNAVTVKAKETRSVSYRVVVEPGCVAGTIPAHLDLMNQDVATNFALALTRNDAAYDSTVHINCGLGQIGICGSVLVFCLNRPPGFPYNTDVDLSDILSQYEEGSQIGIPEHEIVGHMIGTWNEQYALCGSSCGFASTPNLSDFMNTGPLSRHGIGKNECGRWMRTMWSDVPCAVTYGFAPPDCSGPTADWGSETATWNPCTGRWKGNTSGYEYEPSTGNWYDGEVDYSPCRSWLGRDSQKLQLSVYGGTAVFSYALGRWTAAPAC